LLSRKSAKTEGHDIVGFANRRWPLNIIVITRRKLNSTELNIVYPIGIKLDSEKLDTVAFIGRRLDIKGKSITTKIWKR
jgi:hypothetical protein